MTDEDSPTVEAQLAELTERVERLQRQLEQDRQSGLFPPPPVPRPPRRAELREFTAEVAIPGLILLLETNVRALKLLQRTLRVADDQSSGGSGAARRAGELGSAALARLDDALAEAQSVLESEPPDSEARELLEDAQRLQTEIQDRLGDGDTDTDSIETGPSVDVEAELQSIKDQVEDDDPQNGQK